MSPGRQAGVVAALGASQTLAWASSYYLPAVLAAPMARDLGVATSTVFAAFSAAMLVSALVGPAAGRAIDRFGGRPVLVATSLVFAAGLALLAGCTNALAMLAGWLVVGVGMGAGLYEAAFSALVGLYGHGARRAITGVTLVAGFASTVGWPLSAALEAHIGWRGAIATWAALHLLLGLPLNALLPRAMAAATSAATRKGASAALPATPPSRGATALLALVFAATWFVSTAMAAHLPALLESAGVTPRSAVLAGALVGPAQVGARLLEYGLLAHVHPLRSARLAATLHPLGAAVFLAAGPPAAAVLAILHGAGNGILTIAKGTLPLVVFGPHGYGLRQGLLTVPARIAQAFAPWLFGLGLQRWGAGALVISSAITLLALGALACVRTPAPAYEPEEPRATDPSGR